VKPGSFQEKILIGKLRLKDKTAFEQLYDLYIDKIYRFIYFKVSNVSDAEDLTSQTFLKIWQLVLEGKIKGGQSFQAFLYKVARNIVIDSYRISRKREGTVSLDEAMNIADAHTVEQEVGEKMEKEEIEARLKKLKREYQEVIILHYLNELSIKEIADILDKKKGNIRVMIHRALKALKDENLNLE